MRLPMPDSRASTSKEPDVGDVIVTVADVLAAQARLRRYLPPTPLHHAERFGVMLKLENLQRTGSYKVRGALNALLAARERGDTRPVIAASAGNHAQGLAWAAYRLGVQAITVMPHGAPQNKIAGVAALGRDRAPAWRQLRRGLCVRARAGRTERLPLPVRVRRSRRDRRPRHGRHRDRAACAGRGHRADRRRRPGFRRRAGVEIAGRARGRRAGGRRRFDGARAEGRHARGRAGRQPGRRRAGQGARLPDPPPVRQPARRRGHRARSRTARNPGAAGAGRKHHRRRRRRAGPGRGPPRLRQAQVRGGLRRQHRCRGARRAALRSAPARTAQAAAAHPGTASARTGACASRD